MKSLQSLIKSPFGLLGALLLALAGCGGGGSGLSPILGSGGAGIAPTVALSAPAPGAVGAPTTSVVSATFSEAMDPASINGSSFTLACPAGAPIPATVAYSAASMTATLTPAGALPPGTLCVATVTTGARNAGGLPLSADYSWGFTTGALADTTRPTVTLTLPANGALAAAPNSLLSATFSEPMLASSILANGTFTLIDTTLGAPVTGSVSYSSVGNSASFTPTGGVLASGHDFQATISVAATDAAGNALAAPSVWVFRTSGAPDAIAPTVASTNPIDGATGVCLSKVVSATFSEPMDPASISSASFTLAVGGAPVAGSVTYDSVAMAARFTSSAPSGLAPSTLHTATVVSGAAGVKDLAGNPLAADVVINFTTGTQACAGPVSLGSAALFGSFGGAAGVTNQGINTVVNGNLGSTAACTLFTGFHDAANTYTETPLNIGLINGSAFCGPPAPGTTTTLQVAAQARADAQSAYDALAALPAGSDPGAGQLGGYTLAPAVYTAAGGTFSITLGDLTLDAQGDANAVWVFQSASALTVGQPGFPRKVLLINGAQAKNVFWQVGSAARIEDGATMVGNIIAPSGVTISTPGQTAQTTLTGRALSLTASVTMVNTTIIMP